MADPAIVADLVDGCLLTVRIERNNKTLVERACDVLREHGRAIEGIIVNSKTSTRGGYGYSSYDYYGKQGYGYMSSYRKYYAASDESPDRTPSRIASTTAPKPSNGKHTSNS